MEDSKEIYLKLVFVLPSLLSFITAIYSLIYWDDLISKILTVHLACVSCLPSLLEFSPLFRNYVLQNSDKLESNYFRVGVLLYICVATSIFGVGILASVSAIITLIAGIGLLLYQFKHQILEKFGLSSGLETLESV